MHKCSYKHSRIRAVQIAHTNALKSFAKSTQQRNFYHIFASIPIYDGTDKEGFCVRPWLMGLPVNLLWRSVWQELKRCFSNLPTAAHTANSPNTIMQKPDESLGIYVSRHRRLYYLATDKTA